MKLVRFTVVVLWCCAAAAQQHAPQDLAREILWTSPQKDVALFVPATLLNGNIAALPLPDWDRRHLSAIVEGKAPRTLQNGKPCRASLRDARGDFDLQTLPQIIASARTLVLADVVAVVPGWSSWVSGPATAVWIRPVSVFSDADGVIGHDRLLVYQTQNADIEVGGATLCSRVELAAPPRAGDQVLVEVSERMSDPRFLSIIHAFTVRAGIVQPQPSLDVRPFRAIALTTARALARELEVKR